MIEVRKVIQSRLKTIHPQVFYLKAPSDAQYPYIVYELQFTDLGDNLQMITLDIDGWDNTKDTTNLENLMNKINKLFNKQIILNDNLAVFFSLDRRMPLSDNDPQINRRKNIYQGRLYERKVI